MKASSPEIQLQLRALSINLHWNTASNITHLSVNVSYLRVLDGAVVFEYDLEYVINLSIVETSCSLWMKLSM